MATIQERLFTYTVCESIILNAIRDGSHDALHGIMNVTMKGALGWNAMNNFRFAWTAKIVQVARERYAPGHFVKHIDASAASNGLQPGPSPGGDIPKAARAINQILDCHCLDCFRFLVGKNIIAVEGADRHGTTYFDRSLLRRNSRCRDASVEFWDYMLCKLPMSVLLERKTGPKRHFTRLSGTILAWAANYERLFRRWLDRVYTFYTQSDAGAEPDGGYLDGLIKADAGLKIAMWADADMAEKLYSLKINITEFWEGRTFHFWSVLVMRKDAARLSLIPWLTRVPPPVGLNQTHRYSPSHHLPYGRWPPWFVSIWIGDAEAADAFCNVPNIDPLARGWDKTIVSKPPVSRLIGFAVTNRFDDSSVPLLGQWLRRARVCPEWDSCLPDVLTLLDEIFWELQSALDKCLARWEPRSPAAIERANAQLLKREKLLEVGAQLVRLMIDEGAPPGEYPSLAYIPDYANWFHWMGRFRPDYPDLAPLFEQLDQPQTTA